MNKVIEIGRFTKDPDVRYTQGDNPVAIAKFTLAVDRRFKREGQPDADFLPCTAFGKQAEFVEKYMKKGMKVAITGSLQNNDYTNKDGQKVYGFQIVTDEIEFAESKGSGSSSGQQAQQQTDSDGFMNVPTGGMDDLPFA